MKITAVHHFFLLTIATLSNLATAADVEVDTTVTNSLVNSTGDLAVEELTKQEEDGITHEDVGNAVEEGLDSASEAAGDVAETVENTSVDVEVSAATSCFLAGSTAAVILGVGGLML